MRGNVDFIFAFRTNYLSEQKKLYTHFFGLFEDFNTFRKAFLKSTENKGCLVLDNQASKIYWYKAIPGLKFKMGENLWKYLDTKINKDYEKEQQNTIYV